MVKNLGLIWIRLLLVDIEVQQSLSRLLNKTQRNLNGDNSLDGLVIDWHLAEYDYSVESISCNAPIGKVSEADYQPTYASA